MKIILLTVIGALILLWAGVLALLKWVHPILKRHVLWLGVYASVLSGLLIYLVIQTSITQQDAALVKTRARLNHELETFREKLNDLTNRLMGQIVEKAELTESEWKIRGDLQTERSQHTRAREELVGARDQLIDTQSELIKEAASHRAYLDSLNTERALHRATRVSLQKEEQKKTDARYNLDSTREELARVRERLTLKESEIERLRVDLKRTTQSLNNLKLARGEMRQQTEALGLLQASLDSIFLKVLKRPRN